MGGICDSTDYAVVFLSHDVYVVPKTEIDVANMMRIGMRNAMTGRMYTAMPERFAFYSHARDSHGVHAECGNYAAVMGVDDYPEFGPQLDDLYVDFTSALEYERCWTGRLRFSHTTNH